MANDTATLIADFEERPYTMLGFGCLAPRGYFWHRLPAACVEPNRGVVCLSVFNLHVPNAGAR
jgi:hypothetical protein